jgi:hypothetical protein
MLRKACLGYHSLFKGLIVLLFLIITTSSFANNTLGAEIYYRHDSGSHYRIFLVLYANCNGIPPAAPNISITDGTISKTYSTTKSSTSYFSTGIPSGQCTRCSDLACPFMYGFQFITCYRDVDLNDFNGCNLTISWSVSGGTNFGSVTTISGGMTTLYVEVKLNRCYAEHSSPVFKQQAVMLLNDKKKVDMYQNVSPADPNDSIVYRLVPPLSAANTPLKYYTNYDYDHPLIYSGTAITDPKPKGFHYFPNSGELCFIPQKTDVSMIALEADEYAKDKSGNWYLSGYTIRSHVIWESVLTNTKNDPQISGIAGVSNDTIYTCAGVPLKFQVKTYDSYNSHDTITLSSINETGGSFTYSTAINPVATFTWTPLNKDVSNNPYHIILIATDDGSPIGNTIERQFCIYIRDSMPGIKISKSDSGCGHYYFATNAKLSSGFSYKWFADDMAVSTSSYMAYTFPFNGKHIIDLQVTNASGCTWHYYDTVQVSILPDIKAGGGTKICPGSTATLTATGGLKYKWYPATGLSPDTGSAVTSSPKVSTTFYVSGNDAKGCKAVSSVVVDVDSIHLAAPRDTTICYNQPAYIHCKVSVAKSYTWTNLYGTKMSDSAALYFKVVSDTQYLLTVTDSFGCSRIVKGRIFSDRVRANTGRDVSVCFGNSVQLHASGGANYQWVPTLGLITGATIPDPSVRPPQTHDFIVSVSDSLGCYDTDTVKVFVSIVKSMSLAPLSICRGETVRLNAYGGKNYSWSPANNLSNPLISNPEANPIKSTTYFVTVCDSLCGCKVKDSELVTVNDIPVISAGTNHNICAGQKALIGSNPLPAISYRWSSMPAGYGGTSAFDSIMPVSTTTYYLTGTDSGSGCHASDSVKITLHATPKILSGITKVCLGDTQTYSFSDYDPAFKYTWKANRSTILFLGKTYVDARFDSSGNNPLILYSELTGTCRDSTVLVVEASAHPYVHITGPENICLGNIATFLDSGVAATYLWDFGDGTTSSDKKSDHLYTTAGQYAIKLQVSNGACSAKDSMNTKVFDLPLLRPSVIRTSFRQYLLENKDSTGLIYQWKTGDGDSSSYASVIHNYPDTGTYKIRFKYGYPWGCETLFDTVIHVKDVPPVHTIDTLIVGPNPFIDQLFITYSTAKEETIQFAVFDAIGQLIYYNVSNGQSIGYHNLTIKADPGQFRSGIYFLKFKAGEKLTVFKLVKL